MAEEGQVIDVHTVDQWNELYMIGKESKKLMVVDFIASGCEQCQMMDPILADLAKKMPNVIFLKFDVDELKSAAEVWDIEAMPTFIFLKEGKMVGKIAGARKDDLPLTIAKHATAAA